MTQQPHQYYIDIDALERRRACKPQIDLFKATFPSGRAEVTESNLRKAIKAGLQVDWLVLRPYILAPFGSKLEKEAQALYREGCDLLFNEPWSECTLLPLILRASPLWHRLPVRRPRRDR